MERSLYCDLLEDAEARATDEFWQGTCVYVIDVLCELRDLTNKLVAKVNLLKEENEQLKDEKKQLKSKMSKIEKRLSTLEGDHDKLLAGQLASTMDRALLDKILRDSGCLGADELMIFSIKSMKKAIKGEYPYIEVFYWWTEAACKAAMD